MILSMHQPNFIPWIGFFDKIEKSDVFVILDDVQYPRGKSIANRNKILGKNGLVEMVVPISIPKGNDGIAPYTQVNFAEAKWSKKMLSKLEHTYSKAEHFKEYFEFLKNLWQSDATFCSQNIDFIRFVCKELQIDTKIVLQSEIISEDNRKNDLIIALCQSQNCDTYLSGKGASVYNDEELLNKNGISLLYQQFTCPEYKQLTDTFVPNLSILDLLFNEGPVKFSAL